MNSATWKSRIDLERLPQQRFAAGDVTALHEQHEGLTHMQVRRHRIDAPRPVDHFDGLAAPGL